MQPTIRMMHYSGDTDGVVPTYGTKQWIEGLNWDVKERRKQKAASEKGS